MPGAVLTPGKVERSGSFLRQSSSVAAVKEASHLIRAGSPT